MAYGSELALQSPRLRSLVMLMKVIMTGWIQSEMLCSL